MSMCVSVCQVGSASTKSKERPEALILTQKLCRLNHIRCVRSLAFNFVSWWSPIVRHRQERQLKRLSGGEVDYF